MLHAVIMAGGSGTRFWPESRGSRPKQLLPITGGASMLAETVGRLDPLVPLERTWIVTNAQQVEGVRAACPGVPTSNILVEPCARNTAPCVGLAAAVVHAADPEAVMAVLPADHSISPNEEFQRSLQAGADAASEPGVFVTFGIQPTYPATGYGYIQSSGLASRPSARSRISPRPRPSSPKVATSGTQASSCGAPQPSWMRSRPTCQT